jgi:hypothetical protein
LANVFISYARRDKTRVIQLAGALEAEGLSVWWDADLAPGGRYRTIIAEQLAGADCVVVVWTAAALQSDWVQDEAEEGRQRGVLIPVMLEPVRPPAGFRQVQAADLSQWTGGAQHPEFRALAFAVRSLVQRASAGGGVQAVAAPVAEPTGSDTPPPRPAQAAPREPTPAPQPAPAPAVVATPAARPFAITGLFFSLWSWAAVTATMSVLLVVLMAPDAPDLGAYLIFSGAPLVAGAMAFSARRVGVDRMAQRVAAWVTAVAFGLALAAFLATDRDGPSKLAPGMVEIGLLAASVVFAATVAVLTLARLAGRPPPPRRTP